MEELQAEHPKGNGSHIKILEHCTVALIQLVLLLAVEITNVLILDIKSSIIIIMHNHSTE